MLPDLTAEEADGFIRIIKERSPGKLNTDKILAGVEELWKNSLGAVGGEAGALGPDSLSHCIRSGGPGQTGTEVEECSICLDPCIAGDTNTKELKPCHHRFHLHCIQVN